MEEVKRILGERRAGALATVEDGKPRVRPFQLQFEDGGKFYFPTARSNTSAFQADSFSICSSDPRLKTGVLGGGRIL
ncbi:MAG: pyridoxamine 5'-phosphate oxidase family protein, partial [Peptococcaceae bacterium]|nr:pyridoxamine 5'-phosphate oxidase family protein [Peptococcaceae bacterium]